MTDICIIYTAMECMNRSGFLNTVKYAVQYQIYKSNWCSISLATYTDMYTSIYVHI